MHVRHYILNINWAVYFDDCVFIEEHEDVILELDETTWYLQDFLSERLQNTMALSIKIDIRVKGEYVYNDLVQK